MESVIYKITNPKGRIYIGQTINWKIRIQVYKRGDCKKQKKLYNSIKKYGFDTHKFEIIHRCIDSDLNELERYYQDLYSSTDKSGLNIRLTKSSDRSGKFSEDSRRKMSEAKKGTKRSPEVCKAISDKMKEISKQRSSEYYDNLKKSNIGRKHTEERKRNNSKAKKGNTFRKNAVLTAETKQKISDGKIGKPWSETRRALFNEKRNINRKIDDI